MEMEEIYEQICGILDEAIDGEKITNIEDRQKLLALSSFAEFLRAGADVKPMDIVDNVASFKIIMK